MRLLKRLAPIAAMLALLLIGYVIFLSARATPPQPIDPELLAGPAPAPEPVAEGQAQQNSESDTHQIVGTLQPADAPVAVVPVHTASVGAEQPDQTEPASQPAVQTPPDEPWVRLAADRYVAVFRVRHRDVHTLIELLELVPAELKADQATGTLIAAGSGDALRAIAYLVEQLDVPSVEHELAETGEQPAEPRARALSVAPAPPVAIATPAPAPVAQQQRLEQHAAEDRQQTDDTPRAVPAVAHQEDEDRTMPVRVVLRTYRVAAGFLDKPELANLASANACVAAIRNWLGAAGAQAFAISEIDGCVEALTGLGLLASVQARDVALQDGNDAVQLAVAPDGTISPAGDLEKNNGVIVRMDTKQLSLRIRDEEELALGSPDHSYLAYVGGPGDRTDENATGLIVVVAPAPVVSADVKADEKVTPSGYRR